MSPEFIRQLVGVAFFAAGAVAIFLLWLLRRAPRDSEPIILDATPDEPIAFGYKIAWLAIRAGSSDAVARVVGLHSLRPANWETGLEAAIRAQGIFVSPPIDGWVFVAGLSLPEPVGAAQLSAWESWIEQIASEFSQVHYFANHRLTGFHVWARYVDGQETRAFGYVGEQGVISVDRGTPASVEKKWRCNGESGDCVPDEEDVLYVAGEWGLSPISLEDRDYPRGAGLLGQLA